MSLVTSVPFFLVNFVLIIVSPKGTRTDARVVMGSDCYRTESPATKIGIPVQPAQQGMNAPFYKLKFPYSTSEKHFTVIHQPRQGLLHPLQPEPRQRILLRRHCHRFKIRLFRCSVHLVLI